ncbi:MAG: leucine-rich repeat protein [Clostridia bacterium]|nr:leucine-rich repeat protein [Clostridia bacterium]
MKITKTIALTGLTLAGLTIFAACGNRIDTPTGITIDMNNKLTWTAVEDARRYVVEITDVDSGEKKEVSSKKNAYSLSGLEEGEYLIRIKAIAGNKNEQDSEWSVQYEFEKMYEAGCLYSLVNNVEYEIIKAGSASGEVIIDGTYRGKPVTSIADNAFKGTNAITSVVLGENIEYIGKNAFSGCSNLTSVSLPNSVKTIGQSAFKSCRSLKSITIPDTVKELPEEMFAYCRALETVDLGDGLEVIGESAFSDCSALKSITMPESLHTIGTYAFSANTMLKTVNMGESVTTIDPYAFFRCESLTDLNFAEDGELEVIGEYAFSECTVLASVEFPKSLNEIGYASFYDCPSLASVDIPETVKRVREYAFSATKFYIDAVEAKAPLVYADDWIIHCTVKDRLWSIMQETITLDEYGGESFSLKTDENGNVCVIGIADAAFAHSKNLDRINLPKSVKYLGVYSFYKNIELGQVTLYNSSIQTIGERAFQSCTTLSTLNLANNEGESPVKRIDSYAFYGCTLLSNDLYGDSIIPDSVESIGTYAFKNTLLWNMPADDGVVYAGNWVVGYNADTISSVEIREDTRGIADYAFYQCETLRTVRRLAVPLYIGRGAFYGCTTLEVANLNTDMQKIEPYTFYKCISLTSVDMPRELKEIGRSAFYKCEHMGAIELPATLKKIDAYAFYGCTNLDKVTFKVDIDLQTQSFTGVQSIGDYAFYKCATLKELTLPNTLTDMGMRAFGKCDALKKVTFGSGLTNISDRAFQNCVSLEEVVVPSNIKTVGKYAFYKCTSLRNVVLSEGVTQIDDYAFYGVENLWKVSLPQSLERIGKYAFKGCKTLQSVTLRSSVEEIGAHAFYGCKDMTVYTDATKANTGWHSRWNSSYRPVVWGCTFSEDGSYVVSITIGEKTFTNAKATTTLTAPKREGYTFAGWATDAETMEIVYQTGEIVNAPVDTTVYAVWTEGAEEIPALPTPPDGGNAVPAP